MSKKIKCPLTGSDRWVNVDQFLPKPKNMHMNMDSGFITYFGERKTEEELKAYYRKDYRKPVTVQNIFTCQRKLHFHDKFLGPLLKELDAKKQKLVIGEVGAAFGMFLNWVKTQLPNCETEVYGTEWTTIMKRLAFHKYGLKLEDDLDTSVKYDLITSYRVAEHQMDVKEKLEEYFKLLKDDGHLYISVPIWFDTLQNFGIDGFHPNYYFHPDHINVWTRPYFESLLRQCGFKIVQADHIMYDSTYLCVKDEEQKKADVLLTDPKIIHETLGKIQKAWEHFDENRFDQAIAQYPNFPSAWRRLFEMNRKQLNEDGFDSIRKFFGAAVKACPRSPDIHLFIADVCYRYEKFQDALDALEKYNDARPNTPSYFTLLASCFRVMAQKETDEANRVQLLKNSIAVTKQLHEKSFQNTFDSLNWIYFDQCQLPTPHEAPGLPI